MWNTGHQFGLTTAAEAPVMSFGGFPCTCGSGCGHFLEFLEETLGCPDLGLSSKLLVHLYFCRVYPTAEGLHLHFLAIWRQLYPSWLRICVFRRVSCVRFLVLAIFVSEELSNVLALYRHEALQQNCVF